MRDFRRSSAHEAGPVSLPRNVVALGWVSLFTDIATEMIVPLLPLFLVSVLGTGASFLGLVEGTADALSSLLKLVAGGLADRVGRYRPFVLAGYVISSLARPFVALATAPWHVLLVRAVDRTGKGLRTSPRDALIAAATHADRRGTAYGFHRAMDHAGAVLGPLCAILLLELVTQDLRTIFWLAAVPGAIAVAVLLALVREDAPATRAAPAPPWQTSLPSGPLLRLLVPLALFTLGNASDLFLLLKLGGEGAGPVGLSLLWLALHVVKSASSLYAGRLTDRVGPLRMIGAGWIVYALVYGGLALARDPAVMVGLCLVYGTYHGLTEGAEKAWISRIADERARGAAFGWYHLTIGLLALPASVMFGVIWERFGSATAFGLGAALAGAALVLLVLLRPSADLRIARSRA